MRHNIWMVTDTSNRSYHIYRASRLKRKRKKPIDKIQWLRNNNKAVDRPTSAVNRGFEALWYMPMECSTKMCSYMIHTCIYIYWWYILNSNTLFWLSDNFYVIPKGLICGGEIKRGEWRGCRWKVCQQVEEKNPRTSSYIPKYRLVQYLCLSNEVKLSLEQTRHYGLRTKALKITLQTSLMSSGPALPTLTHKIQRQKTPLNSDQTVKKRKNEKWRCVISHLLWYTVLYVEVRVTVKSWTLHKQEDASEAQSHAFSQQDLILQYIV